MSDSNFDVVVVGNVGIDSNAYLSTPQIDLSAETSFTENLDYVGQSGGFSARGFAQYGKKTAFIGYVGQGYPGDFIRREFERDEIDTTALFTDPSGTGRSLNLIYGNGQRKSFYDGKGHMHLKPDLTVCRSVLSQAKLAHFSIPNWARYLLPTAKALGLTISCDIQDVHAVNDPYRQDFIEYADILFFSTVNQTDPRPIMEGLLAQNPAQIVIAGMGARGCAVGTKAGLQFFEAVELEAPILDTTGAGDSLAVGFLSSYIFDGYSLPDSIKRGQIAARHACALRGTSSGLISADMLDTLF